MNMNTTNTENWLLEQMAKMPVVDAHEHLSAEKIRIHEHFDALTFFRQYTRLLMFSAGLDEKTFMKMHDPQQPLDKRFSIFEQYRDLIRFSGPARAAYISLEKFYNEKELTRENFHSITKRMKELYQPGLYHKVLTKTCGIHAALQNAPLEEIDFNNKLLRPIPSLWQHWGGFSELSDKIIEGNCEFEHPDEYLEAQSHRLLSLVEKGAVGFKHKTHYYCEPDRQIAIDIFKQLRQGDEKVARMDMPNPLCNYLTEGLLKIIAKLDVPVAVHTGIGVPVAGPGNSWEDLRQLNCMEMTPFIMRHPDIKFDLFHMGIPSVREMGRIGSSFRNVWLNMCWTHTISPTMAAQALDEWIDQVPANKIIAFGGDVRWPVEKVYGHLVLAREVVAKVLSRRIEAGLINQKQAVYLIERWFNGNARELYKL
ncbi:MAG: amidohydrolase family protein [Planctomycetota bacterium]|jgi:predicted TIM-barrel fold metal-dependent hydrolase